ncbi:hypothetical protein LWI28_013795 [Acer negundo]|uniref:Uncharacterized protein n=1 Tax=Acer negundo TaxID=4023 RepID=A0AAD5JKP4_ACENE|nr:hypothetical protein LWI28_013795 [Acer negundo]KAK4857348.1 hypothetical protein QYF36_027087 [Acer negundo]
MFGDGCWAMFGKTRHGAGPHWPPTLGTVAPMVPTWPSSPNTMAPISPTCRGPTKHGLYTLDTMARKGRGGGRWAMFEGTHTRRLYRRAEGGPSENDLPPPALLMDHPRKMLLEDGSSSDVTRQDVDMMSQNSSNIDTCSTIEGATPPATTSKLDLVSLVEEHPSSGVGGGKRRLLSLPHH